MTKEATRNWKVFTKEISFRTDGHDHIQDITPDVQTVLEQSDIAEGQVTVFTPGSTASVTTIEYEPGLVKDIPELLEEVIPFKRSWQHNQTWGDGNGGSHIRAALIGPSLTVPVLDRAMTLGTWQQIVVIDHDTRGRSRRVVIQVLGQ
jgi:secondary thiamine-phosphate synthase enzyme